MPRTFGESFSPAAFLHFSFDSFSVFLFLSVSSSLSVALHFLAYLLQRMLLSDITLLIASCRPQRDKRNSTQPEVAFTCLLHLAAPFSGYPVALVAPVRLFLYWQQQKGTGNGVAGCLYAWGRLCVWDLTSCRPRLPISVAQSLAVFTPHTRGGGRQGGSVASCLLPSADAIVVT